jgi:integrase
MRRSYRKLGGVLKRCKHSTRDRELCAHAWHYAVQHLEKKHRGLIPGATSREEALAAYQLIAARIRNGLAAFEPAAVEAGLTVEELGTDWLALPRDRKASTRSFYADVLRKHVNPKIGTRAASSITYEDLETLVTGLDATPNTKTVVARVLHALFAFAVTPKRLRTDNPASGLSVAIKDPDTDRDTVEVIDPRDTSKYFPADEAAHLLAVCRDKMPEWEPFVLTAISTGLRLGELRALRYDRINWRGANIALGEKSNLSRRVFTTPKNGKGRTVSLSRRLRAVLYLRWRTAGRPAGLVFPGPRGADSPLAVSTIGRAWRSLLKDAELQYRVFHACRHTHSSLLLQQGRAPAKVAAEAGRSLAETMRVYSHFLPGGNREDAEVLDDLLRGAKDTVSSQRQLTARNGHEVTTNRKLARVG